MFRLKNIFTLVLVVSIATAGFPVQAMPDCPMAKMMQEQQAKQMQDMPDCHKMAKQESQKSGCCDDAACSAKCSAMSGSTSMNLPVFKSDLPALSKQANRLYPADATLTSAHLNSQERPPKSLL